MAEVVDAKIRQRKGHRGYVTKTINTAKELLSKIPLRSEDRIKLETIKTSLTEKIEVLKTLDSVIVENIDDDELVAEEIEHASEFKDNIQLIIIQIDSKLKIFNKQQTTSNTESISAVRHDLWSSPEFGAL